jgi:hypothetical protein
MRLATATGTLFLMLSSLLIWIKAPISGGANPSVSFGWMALLVSGVAGFGWFSRSSRLLAVCAIIGIGLCGFSIVHLALRDSAFWSLVDENAQYASMMSFSRLNLPGNFGIEPFFQIDLSTETVMDRLAAAFYFVGWGWWVCLAGGLLILIPCLKVTGRRSVWWVALTASVVLAGQGMVLFRGLTAQYFQEQGDRDMACARYAEAIARYEDAQRHDPPLTGSEQSHLHLGDAYYQLGTRSHPNARFYLGARYAQRRNFEAALAEYRIAGHEASAPLREIIRKRIAWTYVTMGLTRYPKGEIGPASGWWEIALAFDPSQLQAAYFLMKAYFDQGRFEQSIAMGNLLLLRSQNRLLNANVQASLGDSYWKLNDFSRAREAYEASMKLDSYANFRMFKSLGGT